MIPVDVEKAKNMQGSYQSFALIAVVETVSGT